MAELRVRMRGMTKMEKRIEGAQQRMKDLSPALKVPAERFRALVDQSFRKSTGPDGKAWPKLDDRYAKRKAKQGYSSKPLIRRGARGMQGLIGIEATPTGVKLATSPLTPYAPVHQFGGGDVPRRPFLPVSGTPRRPRIMDSPAVRKILDEMRARIEHYIVTGKSGTGRRS